MNELSAIQKKHHLDESEELDCSLKRQKIEGIVLGKEFFYKIVVQQNNAFVLVRSKILDKSKLKRLRNSISIGDTICLNLKFEKNENLRNARAVAHVANFLAILRLKPGGESSSLLFDISKLVNEKTQDAFREKFPQIKQEKEGSWVIPCTLAPLYDKPSDSNEDKFYHFPSLPSDLKALVSKFLTPNDFYSLFSIYPLDANTLGQLSDKCKALASYETKELFQHLYNCQNHNHTHAVGSFYENTQLLRKNVKELSFWQWDGCNLRNISFIPISKYFHNMHTVDAWNLRNADDLLVALSGVAQLKTLNLSSSDVTGKTFNFLPDTLEKLSCSFCKKLEEDEIRKLAHSNLKELDLSNSDLSGKEFGKLPKSLKILHCSSCFNLSEDAIAKLGHTALESLDISHTHISGAHLSTLPPTLKHLNMTGPNVTDKTIAALGSFPALVELSLACASIMGHTFGLLPKSLKKLDCMDCLLITDAEIRNLKNSSLEWLSLHGIFITGECFDALPHSLKTLGCSNYKLTPQAYILLEQLKKTQDLSVDIW
jgi:uncharacterized protein YjbI with pentapeptide repeats